MESKRPGRDQVECGVEMMNCVGARKPTSRPPPCKFLHQFFELSLSFHSAVIFPSTTSNFFKYAVMKQGFHEKILRNKPVKYSDTVEKNERRYIRKKTLQE